jgi:AcrR family transcriptional regulator
MAKRIERSTINNSSKDGERSSSNKRGTILDAAAGIVERSGAAHLTMDAVAAAAGVSKGGVLYHFHSKQALLEGMLQRLLDQVESRTASYLASEPQQAGSALEAHVLAEHDRSPAERAMARALLAAAAEQPELLAPARQAVADAFADAGRTITPGEYGWIVLLASEGLRFLDMLDLLPLSESERQRVHERLLEMARENPS